LVCVSLAGPPLQEADPERIKPEGMQSDATPAGIMTSRARDAYHKIEKFGEIWRPY